MFRKFVVFTAVLGLIIGGASAVQATDAAPGDAYQGENSAVDSNSQVLATISDVVGQDWTGLMRQIPLDQQGPSREGWANCSGLDDPSCDFRNEPSGVYQGQVVLQPCTQTESSYCVESLELAAPGGDFQPATFIRKAKQKVWTMDSRVNFPGGGGALLYEAPNAPTAGGFKTYALDVSLKASWEGSLGHFNLHDITAQVLPYRGYENAGIRGIAGWGDEAGTVCSWKEPGYCGVAQDWVEGTKVRLKFKMPSDIAGWFKGRIQKPEIQINPVDAKTNEVTVAAEPVGVAQLAVVSPASEKDALLNTGWDMGWWGGPGFVEVGMRASDRDVAKFINRYRKQLGDSSSGTTTMWNFSTVNSGGGSDCLQSTNKLLGVVTTNAMGYDGSAPSFEDQTLTYHVSGMHYLADGKTLTEGTYDLVMRSDVARCLYGFTSAPISATVSVVDDSGQAKTAVTMVNEKDGWLKMAAYGFTFSNPILNVKISQEKVVEPVVSGGTSAGSESTNTGKVVAKKTTITCVKGKIAKKVTAVKPKCPAGYKKKG